MKKDVFLEEIKEILLVDGEFNEETGIKIDSMSSLMLIAFFDENFGKLIPETVLKEINNVSDIIEIVGENNLE